MDEFAIPSLEVKFEIKPPVAPDEDSFSLMLARASDAFAALFETMSSDSPILPIDLDILLED